MRKDKERNEGERKEKRGRRVEGGMRKEEQEHGRELKENLKRDDRKDSRFERWAQDIERQRKQNNIIITDLDGDMKEEQLQNWIVEILEVRIVFKDMWRTGDRKMIIIAVCRSKEEKEKIMRSESKLGRERIFIDNDLTWNERKIREKLEGKEIKLGQVLIKCRPKKKNEFGIRENRNGFKNRWQTKKEKESAIFWNTAEAKKIKKET